LTLKRVNTYNIRHAEVAQVVEQRTENPRVSSSTLLLGTSYEIGAHSPFLAAQCPLAKIERVSGLAFNEERAEVAER
jgi:hypothetical protein